MLSCNNELVLSRAYNIDRQRATERARVQYETY